jgi:UDP-N-acetylglucosamine:LPS N-acetylglucosamine transferase
MNIAFVSSQGGHSGQIKLLFDREVIGKNNAIFITETPKKDISPIKNSFNNKFTTYFFIKDYLLIPNPYRYIKTFMNFIKLFKKEKIDMIVTNGAQLSIPAIIAAKVLRIKTLFIDTVIRVKTPNWSARACYIFSDIFLVQHPQMAKKYGKKAEYHGGIV